MFWQSVVSGLFGLFDLRTLLVMAFLVIASLFYEYRQYLERLNILVLILTQKWMTVRCRSFLNSVINYLVNSTFVAIFVWICLPVIVGDQAFSEKLVLTPPFWSVFTIALTAESWLLPFCLLSFSVPFKPARLPAIIFYLQAPLVVKPILKSLYAHASHGSAVPSTAFPSFWTYVGFIAVTSIVMAALASFIETACNMFLKPKIDYSNRLEYMLSVSKQLSTENDNTRITDFLLQPIIGLIPTVMYGRYVGLAIRNLVREV
jgi:hypothetical protein